MTPGSIATTNHTQRRIVAVVLRPLLHSRFVNFGIQLSWARILFGKVSVVAISRERV